MGQEFFLNVRNQIQGPYELEHLQIWVNRGLLKREQLISYDGELWFPADDVWPKLSGGGEVEPRTRPDYDPAGESTRSSRRFSEHSTDVANVVRIALHAAAAICGLTALAIFLFLFSIVRRDETPGVLALTMANVSPILSVVAGLFVLFAQLSQVFWLHEALKALQRYGDERFIRRLGYMLAFLYVPIVQIVTAPIAYRRLWEAAGDGNLTAVPGRQPHGLLWFWRIARLDILGCCVFFSDGVRDPDSPYFLFLLFVGLAASQWIEGTYVTRIQQRIDERRAIWDSDDAQ